MNRCGFDRAFTEGCGCLIGLGFVAALCSFVVCLIGSIV